jgi:hypothetical protein
VLVVVVGGVLAMGGVLMLRVAAVDRVLECLRVLIEVGRVRGAASRLAVVGGRMGRVDAHVRTVRRLPGASRHNGTT